jgi:magnesium-transporting ATPase (P-type)
VFGYCVTVRYHAPRSIHVARRSTLTKLGNCIQSYLYLLYEYVKAKAFEIKYIIFYRNRTSYISVVGLQLINVLIIYFKNKNIKMKEKNDCKVEFTEYYHLHELVILINDVASSCCFLYNSKRSYVQNSITEEYT